MQAGKNSPPTAGDSGDVLFPKNPSRQVSGHFDIIISLSILPSRHCHASRYASLYEKLFLKGVLAEFKRSGVEEATFREVCERVNEIYAIEGELWGEGIFENNYKQ